MLERKLPGFAYSSGLEDSQAENVMEAVISAFNSEVKDQWIATTKIIV